MKIKEVKTTITHTKAQVTAYSDETGIVETTCLLMQTFKTERGLEDALREYLRHDGLGLVKVNSVEKLPVTYKLPIEKFMEAATVVEN